MFKNLSVFRLEAASDDALQALEAALAREPFQPCGPSQPISQGWLAPRGLPHAPLIESIAGHWLMRYAIESKRVPAAVVRRELQARCAHIEATQGRQPGRREQRELKEAIEHELLPMAFPQTVHVQLWWDVQRQRLALDTTSAKRIDAVLSALLRAVPTLRVEPLSTAIEPSTAMANWLASNADEWPACFAPGRETELRADGDKPAVVRFARHILDAEEMRRHLAQGKRPTRLALDWQGRVSFVLTQNLQLRRIAFADGIDEAQDVPADERFDADAALATGELSALLSDLIEALGGCAPLSP